jgi:hypothetical protein
MAKYTGDSSVTFLGGTAITANDVIDVTFGWANGKVENDGVSDTFESNLTTTTVFTFTVNGYDDSPGTSTAGSMRAVVMAIQSQADHQDTFDLRPFGTSAGKRKVTGTAHLDNVTYSNGHKANALITATFTATGTVTDTTQ